MKKLVVGASLFLVLAAGYYMVWPHVFNSPCETNKLKLSSTDIEVKDRDYLKISMGFSYGSQLKHFLPRLKTAQSNTYYKRKKSKPWMTYFSSGYKTRRSARSAYNYLKKKWRKNKKNQYDVMLNGKTVTWFGNNRMTPQCFSHVVALEKERIKKLNPVSSSPKALKRVSKAKTRKKRSKRKVRRKKKRQVVASKKGRRKR